ncbi:capsular exopolysaccharide family protein [Thermomicrobiaceae bacterium CFH 74404]|uniref:Capsular exopolysaccharide family protein n=1 Tax=Thermalbibacter longus TaxID=2951981 RepID=A0AA41WB11_9BACT|nr:capsular exopolysaccharide family protein [Thermalbibacter longus]MCM8749629.1 capsular exopolysaccharide family protein [Thermalbibacter longus]
MRPEEYLAILARRWWILVVAALVAGLAAFLYTSAQPRTYQVSVRLMAVAQPPDYWLDLYAKNRLASYQDLIRSWDFVSQALRQAGLDIDPGHAMGTLTLGRNQDSNLVQIVVTDTDPQRAAAIANAVADAFVARSAAENQQILERFTDPRGERIQGTVEVVKLESPGPPSIPIGPRVKLNSAAGLLLGLAFGVVLAFGVEYFDDRLRNERDVQRYLALATIGQMKHNAPSGRGRRGSSMRSGNPDSRLAVVAEPTSPEAEAYRSLRAAIVFAGGERAVRSVLVAEAGSGNDSPLVAANLAAALALAGDRVALVDANLRTPRLHGLLGRSNDAGLAEWLRSHDPEAPLPLVATAYDRLLFVPAGSLSPAGAVNPADLLSQPRFAAFLEKVCREVAYTVIDTAPAPDFGDALAIAPRVDGVVLLVRSGHTRRTAAQSAKQALERVGARLLGVVMLQR